MLVGVTDEGELAKSIARHFKQVVIIDSPQRVVKERPNVVIHTFEVPYDESNRNPSTAWNINTWYSINVARSASKVSSTNVFLSTFMVFDGRKGYYTETSTPNPLNYYGLSKLSAETGIMSLGNYLVVRLGALYSTTYRGIFHPFIKGILKGKRTIKCNSNFYVSPVTVDEASEIISSLVKRGIKGVVNIGGKRRSMLSVCEQIGDIFNAQVISYEGKYFDFSLDDWLLRGLGFTVRS
ncbi:sugar nucleotide-binding protein [Stygiolobus caldivivus]|uniref:dTDP-4-dehydrorhamnose reductase n=1 Tax=Stygiolobus caldivivus TaxID=2824673 RepID=A0A8D5ZI52_9CREN|nr:sugar nucleotide-binding protein [Stygiolobus caldivivus]BCU70304.1 dTDP-4-dehydrorhamnose reductase [Stygiolobus caldivivus]